MELAGREKDGINSGVIIGVFVAPDALHNGRPETNGAHGRMEISLVSNIFISFVVFLKFKMDGDAIRQWETGVAVVEFFFVQKESNVADFDNFRSARPCY